MLKSFVSGLTSDWPDILINLGDIPSGPYDSFTFRILNWSDNADSSMLKAVNKLVKTGG